MTNMYINDEQFTLLITLLGMVDSNAKPYAQILIKELTEEREDQKYRAQQETAARVAKAQQEEQAA